MITQLTDATSIFQKIADYFFGSSHLYVLLEDSGVFYNSTRGPLEKDNDWKPYDSCQFWKRKKTCWLVCCIDFVSFLDSFEVICNTSSIFLSELMVIFNFSQMI